MPKERSPDMIWFECAECERNYTLADAEDEGRCPRCYPAENGGNTDE